MALLDSGDGGTEDDEQDSTSDDSTESGYIDAPDDSTQDTTDSGDDTDSTTDRGTGGGYVDAPEDDDTQDTTETTDDTTDSGDGTDSTDDRGGDGSFVQPEEETTDSDSGGGSGGLEQDDSGGYNPDRGTGGGTQEMSTDGDSPPGSGGGSPPPGTPGQGGHEEIQGEFNPGPGDPGYDGPPVGGPPNTEFDTDGTVDPTGTGGPTDQDPGSGGPDSDDGDGDAGGTDTSATDVDFDSTTPEYEGEIFSQVEHDIIQEGGSDIHYAEVDGGLVARYENEEGQTVFAPVPFEEDAEDDVTSVAEAFQEDANEQAVADQVEGVDSDDIRFVDVTNDEGEVVQELSKGSQEEIGQAALADELGEETAQNLQIGEDFTFDTSGDDGETAIELTAFGEERVAASEFGVDHTEITVTEEGSVVPETDAAAEAIAEQSVTQSTASDTSVSTEEVVPGVYQATAENTGGLADAPGSEERTAVAATSEGVGLLDELAEYEDVRANLQEQAQQSLEIEAGQEARANAAALDEASGFTQSLFSSDDTDDTAPETAEMPGQQADDQQDVTSGADTDEYGVEVPELEDLDQQGPQAALGQQSVSEDLDSPLTPDAKQGGEGVTDFLQTGAARTQPALQAALNPGSLDGIPNVDQSPVTDPAGDVLRGAGGAAAAQFAVFAPVSDEIGSAASTVETQLRRTPDVLQDASDTTVSVTEDVVEGADDATGGALSTGATGLLEAGVDTADAAGELSADIEQGTRQAAGGAAAAAAIYTAPFARESSPVREAGEEAASATQEVGELSAATVGDVAESGADVAGDLDDATDGALSDAAGVAGRPAAGTLIVGQQTAETAQDVNQLDETDFEDATDQFIASALRDDSRVTGGPLPVFSVATPGGVQSFLSSSDDAATAAQLADDTASGGTAAAGGTATGGGTGTGTAAVSSEVMETASLSTAGAFVDELDVSEGGLFVDEQEVTGVEDVFVDEKPIPDPQQLDVGPLGVPELGVRIGPGENQANWEIDELETGEMFVDELEVTPDDDAPSVGVEAGTAVGTGSGAGTTTGPGSTPGTGPSIGDVGEGGGFDVGGQPSAGLVIGSDSGVRIVGRTPNPESTLTDAAEEFFGIDVTDPYTGADALEDAQETGVGAGDATDPYVGGSTVDSVLEEDAGESEVTDLEDVGSGSFGDFGPGTEFGDGSGVGTGATTGPVEGTVSTPVVDAPAITNVTDLPTGLGTGTPTAGEYETPNLPDYGTPTGPGYGYPFQPSPPNRPNTPRPPLPDPTDSDASASDIASLFE